MSDSYQAIYDAVRSRISGGDFGQAMESALRGPFSMVNHAIRCVAHDWSVAAAEQQRPSVLFRPSIKVDGNKWSALYGDNLQDGVAGFGDSPEEAMRDFDANWSEILNKKAEAA